MKYIIDRYVIDSPIENIISKIQEETVYCQDVKKTNENIIVSCPFHKDGKERKPSCSINILDDIDVPYGTFHCWSCGAHGSLAKLVSKCYATNLPIAEEWLVSNYSNSLITQVELLPKIELQTIKSKKEPELSDELLSEFEYDNDEALEYLTVKRRLSKKVIDFFKIGYDKQSDAITFPIWDTYGRLVGVARRNLHTKFYNIPKLSNKPIYLLDTIKKYKYTTVYVVESQINALTLWGWGYPSVALFGTGSEHQYNLLKKSGIRNFVLCFDGDTAGRQGAKKLVKTLPVSSMVTVVQLPESKDVNDLTKEEFERLPRFDRNDLKF